MACGAVAGRIGGFVKVTASLCAAGSRWVVGGAVAGRIGGFIYLFFLFIYFATPQI